MKIQEIFKNTVTMNFSVPLAITELGFVYLNDNGMFNITINWKNSNCINKTITAQQLLDLFEQHSSCYETQQEYFEEKKLEMINEIKKIPINTIIETT